jgi:ubiquinone/menaquinone biosynthesis C-methylase UbiE
MQTVAETTGDLFGPLWTKLTDEQYRQSVDLFTKRALANGFDLEWLKGKSVLDAGCGSGRYSVALAMHGAAEIQAIDVSQTGLEEARRRAVEFPQIDFKQASVLDIPFPDNQFDLVWCAGVIHHTTDFQKGISEVSRVVKKGDGKLFLLLYGAGGLQWKLVKSLRPLIRDLGADFLSKSIKVTGLPANNRKHFMDDLLTPIQKLTTMSELTEVLHQHGFNKVDRWTGETFDHESTLDTKLEDMEKIQTIIHACDSISETEEQNSLCKIMLKITASYCAEARSLIDNQNLSGEIKKQILLGEGHLRVVAS